MDGVFLNKMLGESLRGFLGGLVVDCYVGAGAGELFADYGAEASVRECLSYCSCFEVMKGSSSVVRTCHGSSGECLGQVSASLERNRSDKVKTETYREPPVTSTFLPFKS